MPNCKNDSTRKYSGDEPSPKGLGFCAHAEREELIKKGNDGNMWKVKKDKNGTKRWVKNTPGKYSKLTKEQSDKLKELKSEMKKLGVKFFVETIKPVDGFYFTDEHLTNVAEKLGTSFWSGGWDKKGNDVDNGPILIMAIFHDGNNIDLTRGGFYITHSGIKNRLKKNVIEVFKRLFGKNYKWDGKQSTEIFIKL